MTADQIAEVLRSEAAIADRPGQYDRLMAQADAVDSVLGEVYRLRAALEEAESGRQLLDLDWVEALQRVRDAQRVNIALQARIDAALITLQSPYPGKQVLPGSRVGPYDFQIAVEESRTILRAALTTPEPKEKK